MSTTHEPHDRHDAAGGAPVPPPPADFAAQANARADIYEAGLSTSFWDEQGRGRVSTGSRTYTELYEWQPPYAKWYLGGTPERAFNCLDRHVEAGLGDRIAFHWEGEPER